MKQYYNFETKERKIPLKEIMPHVSTKMLRYKHKDPLRFENRGYLILSAFVLSFLILNIFYSITQISGASMYPTYKDGQIVYALKTNFAGEIQRNDVVIAYYDDEKIQIIKRVIGLPGEKVSLKNGRFYINDMPIDDIYQGETISHGFNEIVLKEDEYFLVGDNRDVSLDSRISGPFKANNIIAVIR